MELEGYNKSLKVAFEAQGEHHYRVIAYFNQTLKDLEHRIEDDSMKLDLCKQNYVILIQVPYYVHPNKLKHYTSEKFERLSNKKSPMIPKID
jgi:hypothetical protein